MDRNRFRSLQQPGYQVRRPTQRPTKSRSRKLPIIAIIVALLVAGIAFVYFGRDQHRPGADTKSNASSESNAQASFDKKQHSIDDPTSIWVVVNKPRPLSPINYKPADLVVPNVPLRTPGAEYMQMRAESAKALEELFAAAKASNFNLLLTSGYRSYDVQVSVYNGYIKSMGQAETDRTSARPGHSEHQTGWAVDVEPSSKKCELEACFGDMPEGAWVSANAYRFGFIIRYTKDKESVTGYAYEPWHLRYVGTDLADEMHHKGVETLEEFFSVAGGTEY